MRSILPDQGAAGSVVGAWRRSALFACSRAPYGAHNVRSAMSAGRVVIAGRCSCLLLFGDAREAITFRLLPTRATVEMKEFAHGSQNRFCRRTGAREMNMARENNVLRVPGKTGDGAVKARACGNRHMRHAPRKSHGHHEWHGVFRGRNSRMQPRNATFMFAHCDMSLHLTAMARYICGAYRISRSSHVVTSAFVSPQYPRDAQRRSRGHGVAYPRGAVKRLFRRRCVRAVVFSDGPGTGVAVRRYTTVREAERNADGAAKRECR